MHIKIEKSQNRKAASAPLTSDTIAALTQAYLANGGRITRPAPAKR